jgi:hypothetical protein
LPGSGVAPSNRYNTANCPSASSMIDAGITGLFLKCPCKKNSWPVILYFPLAPLELTDASFRKRNGG